MILLWNRLLIEFCASDPTLRMYIVDPPTNVTQDLSETSGVKLLWNTSSDAVLGYHVYRSSVSIEGPYTRVTTQLVNGNTFTDTSAANGKNYYMVRAIQLTQTPATTFYNPSQAAFFETTFVAPPQSTPPSSTTPSSEAPSTTPSATTPSTETPSAATPQNTTPITDGTISPDGSSAPSSSSRVYVPLLCALIAVAFVM